MEGMRLATDPVSRRLFDFWIKIFAASFGMGIVSGILMAFQFGTNWSVLAENGRPIQRPLLGFTVLLLEQIEPGNERRLSTREGTAAAGERNDGLGAIVCARFRAA